MMIDNKKVKPDLDRRLNLLEKQKKFCEKISFRLGFIHCQKSAQNLWDTR
jgi:hypothetical protein